MIIIRKVILEIPLSWLSVSFHHFIDFTGSQVSKLIHSQGIGSFPVVKASIVSFNVLLVLQEDAKSHVLLLFCFILLIVGLLWDELFIGKSSLFYQIINFISISA